MHTTMAPSFPADAWAWIRKYRWEVGIVALALLARLIYLGIAVETSQGLLPAISGADGYYVVSQNLIDGHGLSSSLGPPYEPYSFRPPFYHFFIAGAHYVLGGFLGVILLQITIGSALPVLGMRIAAHVLENKTLLRTIGILLALEPSAILYSGVFYSETFFMLLLFGSIWALLAYMRNQRTSFLAVSAVLLGLATLTRPTAQYLPVIITAVLLWRAWPRISREVLVAIGMYVALFLLVLAPWIYRNYSVFGVAGISPQTGVNLHMTLLPTVYSIARGTTFQKEFADLEAAGVRGPNNAYITDGGPYAKAAIPLLLEEPKALALSGLNSIWSFFVLDGMYDFLRHIEIRPAQVIGKPAIAALVTDPAGVVSYFARNIWGPVAFILFMRLVWIGIAVLFLYGAWNYFRLFGLRPAAVLLFSIVLYFAATSVITGYGLTARYRLPVNAFVLMFAAYGTFVVFQKIRARI